MGLLQSLDETINAELNGANFWREPEEKTKAINLAQLSYFFEIVGPPSEYQPGRPVPRRNFSETSLQYSLVSQFYVTGIVSSSSVSNLGDTIWDATSVLDVNDEMFDVLLISGVYDGDISSVKVLTDNQVRQRLKSTLVPPSEDVPIGQLFPNFQYAVYPTPDTVQIKCLRVPRACNIVYTNDEYDPALSTDLEWGMDALTPLFNRTLIYLGINTQRPTLMQEGRVLSQQV